VATPRAAPNSSAAPLATNGVPSPPMARSQSLLGSRGPYPSPTTAWSCAGVQRAPVGGVAQLATAGSAGLLLGVAQEREQGVRVEVVNLDRPVPCIGFDHAFS